MARLGKCEAARWHEDHPRRYRFDDQYRRASADGSRPPDALRQRSWSRECRWRGRLRLWYQCRLATSSPQSRLGEIAFARGRSGVGISNALEELSDRLSAQPKHSAEVDAGSARKTRHSN